MAKEDSQFHMEGEVVEILPNAMFRVLVDGQEKPVIGVISGKMRQSRVVPVHRPIHGTWH